MAIPTESVSIAQNPYSGTFGNGQVAIFVEDGTFTIPVGVSKVRVRLWGAGGTDHGGGGGFAMKEITLGSETSVAVTVGVPGGGGSAYIGGTSSFGSYVSATGGTGNLTSYSNVGGTGVGGDVNYTGGRGNGSGDAGGGCAGLFGDGGDAAVGSNKSGLDGCAGGGGGTAANYQGGNGVTGTGAIYFGTYGGSPATGSDMVAKSIDFFGTGGGGYYSFRPTNGGGGANSQPGAFPGGGGGASAIGGNGLVIVEY